MRKLIPQVVAIALLAACSNTDEAKSPAAVGSNPKPAAAVAPAPAPAQADPRPSANLLTGKVAETMDAGGYTYVKVQTANGEQWAAVPQAKVAKGDTVSIASQMTMEKFESKSLNRTFDTIVFGSIVTPGAAPAAAPAGMQAQMPAGHPPTGAKMPGQMPPQMASAMGGPSQHMKVADVGDIKVEKAEGGKTVAELWSQRADLNGKPVVIRGKVVKFLGGIMGKNWMHIQDGTGSGEKGDNDITVTTDANAAVGSIVTVKGTLVTDKDFGAGYRYEVILENAKIQ